MLQPFEGFSNLDRIPGKNGVHDVRLSALCPSIHLSVLSYTSDPFGRSLLAQTLSGLTHLLITLAFSLFSFHFGRSVALSSTFPPLPTLPRRIRPTARWITTLLPPTLYLLILLLAILAPNRTDRTLLLTLLFAPPGTVVRYHLGLRLNPVLGGPLPEQEPIPDDQVTEKRRRRRWRRPRGMPVLGTLTANLLATAVLAVAFLLQRTPDVATGTTRLACQVGQAMEDGFCGSLSTVSTFVAELDGMQGWRRRGAYAGTSLVLGVVVVVAIVGGGWWSGGGLGEGCML